MQRRNNDLNEEVKILFKQLKGGDVKRYHTMQIIGEQSVGAHSWGVTLILLFLYPEVSKKLLIKSIFHDVVEVYTGDFPAPAKWENPDLAKVVKDVEARYEKKLGLDFSGISKEEQRIFKQADMFELLVFCVSQRRLGNTNMNKVFSNGVEYLTETKLNDRGQAFLAYLIKIYGGL